MRKSLFILIFLLTPTFSVRASIPVQLPDKQIRILLVPGHDDKVWGAQYGNIKEADMNLVLATQIFNLLKKDKRFKVYITRDQSGYTKEFEDYFILHKADIAIWEADAKKTIQNKIASGTFIAKVGAPHMNASSDVALRLYGFNKWANENNIDAMIHIHFNDYPLSSVWQVGKYKGFVIYKPEAQMLNAKVSAILASNIWSQLYTKYQTSTFKPEKGGLISDQELIALGANNTLVSSVRSVLVEYGYIYQKIFRNSITRHQAYSTMSGLTAKGITKYFFGK